MATSQSTYPTMMDVARRLDPNGKIDKIVELMNTKNEILADAMFLECNSGTSNITTVRNGLPDVAWLRAYKGIPASKSTTTQVSDSVGRLGARSEVAEMILEKQQDKAGFRLSEAGPHIEAMQQEFASTLFYGNVSSDPDEFTGLAVRFNKHSGTDTEKTSFNVIDGGGDGSDNSSIWFVGWSDVGVHCLFPQGSTVGIKHTDIGREAVRVAATGATYYAQVETWDWDVGLAVRDWRHVCRIANIDISKLDDANPADIMKLLIEGYHKVRRYMRQGRFAIYMNRTLLKYLDTQCYDTVKGTVLSYKEIDGQEILNVRGMPIRECDALLETEDAIAAAS